MRTYLIAYDLANPNAKKHALADIIMSLGVRWARPLEQTWYVTATETEADIEAALSWLLGDDDGLIVQAVDDPAVLTNTALRWFRRRSASAEAAQLTESGSNVVAFAVPSGPTPLAA
ncbi:MAG: hypothetical protein NW205_11915 [Hyphomicrobiaceae bacterium]|nr:hypothetical protein [Hyphomicrobiaceae bacterium]